MNNEDIRQLVLAYRSRRMTWGDISRRLNYLEVTTPTGMEWSPSGIRNHAKRHLGVVFKGNAGYRCPGCGDPQQREGSLCRGCQNVGRSPRRGSPARRLAYHCGVASAAALVGADPAEYRTWAEGTLVPVEWRQAIVDAVDRFDDAAYLRDTGERVPLYADRPIVAENFTHKDR